MTTLHFAAACLQGQTSSSRLLSVTPTELVIAGWTGRNHAAIEHHIEELEALGVPRPSTVPLYYRVSHQQLTQTESIQALGAESSGEAEPVLFFTQGEWWLTVGSDHTDRQVETYSVAVSKQMCAKPVARVAWRWVDVLAHQDSLWLRSRIWEGGNGCCIKKASCRAFVRWNLCVMAIGNQVPLKRVASCSAVLLPPSQMHRAWPSVPLNACNWNWKMQTTIVTCSTPMPHRRYRWCVDRHGGRVCAFSAVTSSLDSRDLPQGRCTGRFMRAFTFFTKACAKRRCILLLAPRARHF